MWEQIITITKPFLPWLIVILFFAETIPWVFRQSLKPFRRMRVKTQDRKQEREKAVQEAHIALAQKEQKRFEMIEKLNQEHKKQQSSTNHRDFFRINNTYQGKLGRFMVFFSGRNSYEFSMKIQLDTYKFIELGFRHGNPNTVVFVKVNGMTIKKDSHKQCGFHSPLPRFFC